MPESLHSLKSGWTDACTHTVWHFWICKNICSNSQLTSRYNCDWSHVVAAAPSPASSPLGITIPARPTPQLPPWCTHRHPHEEPFIGIGAGDSVIPVMSISRREGNIFVPKLQTRQIQDLIEKNMSSDRVHRKACTKQMKGCSASLLRKIHI